MTMLSRQLAPFSAPCWQGRAILAVLPLPTWAQSMHYVSCEESTSLHSQRPAGAGAGGANGALAQVRMAVDAGPGCMRRSPASSPARYKHGVWGVSLHHIQPSQLVAASQRVAASLVVGVRCLGPVETAGGTLCFHCRQAAAAGYHTGQPMHPSHACVSVRLHRAWARQEPLTCRRRSPARRDMPASELRPGGPAALLANPLPSCPAPCRSFTGRAAWPWRAGSSAP